MNIVIDYAVGPAVFTGIERLMQESVQRDGDLNGVVCTVERGDSTLVEHADEIVAARVLAAIQAEIAGEREVPEGYGMTVLGNLFDARGH